MVCFYHLKGKKANVLANLYSVMKSRLGAKGLTREGVLGGCLGGAALF